ncbi:hypothetical protein HZH66_004390 [Vespula vulgaris]|uniref:Odorant receptor n=1 Tax=Vespula vulgaris TaxID=7454 RepID=A0A834NEU3_VESVU|nr:hypothetical protein HZH66_004390 [Vespula vulgaris]
MELIHHEIHWDLARGKKLRSNLELQSVNRNCIHHLVLHITSIDNAMSRSRRLRHGYGKLICGQHERNDSIHKDDMLLVQRRTFLYSFLFVVSIKEMKDLLSAMEEDWKEIPTKEDEKKMMKQAKFSRILATRATFICYALIAVYAVKRCLSMRTDGRLLFLSSYFPYETMTSPIFELTFICQVIGSVYYTTAYTTVDTFLAMLILHVCEQLARLQNELIDLNSSTRKDFQIKLSYIVKRHEHLNRFLYSFLFVVSIEEMKDLLSAMEEDWKEVTRKEDEKKMMKQAKFSRILASSASFICYALMGVYAVKRFLTMRTEGRLLFLSAYFPYETMTSPKFEFTILGQMIGLVYYTTAYTTVDTFVAMLILHVCGQLSRLQNELIDLNSSTRKDFQVKLSYIVKRHEHLNSALISLHLLKNSKHLRMINYIKYLHEYKFQLMVDDGEQMPVLELFFFAFYIIYVLLQLYLYCYVGEQLWSESTEVARAAYECEWYELLPNEARSLILIIRRSRSPLRLTAGKFCIFNHELYSSVLKTSMGYLSVLRATIMKDE